MCATPYGRDTHPRSIILYDRERVSSHSHFCGINEHRLLNNEARCYLDFGVHASGQEQMRRFWKVADGRNALGVSSIGVQQLLWYKASLRSRLAVQVDIQIQRDMHVGPSHIIVLLLAMENGRL